MGGLYIVDALAIRDGCGHRVSIGSAFNMHADALDKLGNGHEVFMDTDFTSARRALSALVAVSHFGAMSAPAFHVTPLPSPAGLRRNVGGLAVRMHVKVPEPQAWR